MDAAHQPSQFDRAEFDLVYPPGIESHYWSLARSAIIRAEIRRHRWTALKWLEVGCGRGIVLQALRQAGVNVVGVELAAVPPPEALAGHVFYGQDACDLPEQMRGTFSGVMLLDVIEHIADPVRFLTRLLERLPNVRAALITVPAHQTLWSNYDQFYGHHRRYDRLGLAETVSASGLSPVRMGHFFHALYPPARLLVMTGRQRSVKVSAPGGLWKPIHALLGAAFVAEAAVLPAHWPGTSLMCAARRDR
jgi:SAM-dependent methyltransferase